MRPIAAVALAFFLGAGVPQPAVGATTYTWIGPNNGSWQTSTHWSPTRTTPASDDVLVFDVTISVSQVPNQTFGQLVIEPGIIVSVTGVTPGPIGYNLLSITGGAGPDVEVKAGSQFILNGSAAIRLSLGAGCTGLVSGLLRAGGGAHRVLATDVDAIVFASGGEMVNAISTGAVFGTTNLNSIRFQAGSVYRESAITGPFGAAAPATVVNFDPGSRYQLNAVPSPTLLTGRTLADFEYNVVGSQTQTGTVGFTVDSLIVRRGVMTLAITDTLEIRGDIRVDSAGTLNVSPASGPQVVNFVGDAMQRWRFRPTGFATHNFTANSNVRFRFDNPAHVNMPSNLITSSSFEFVRGQLITHLHQQAVAGALYLKAPGTILGASSSTGWINGYLNRNYGLGISQVEFPVGDSLGFAPVTQYIFNAAGSEGFTIGAFAANVRPSGAQLDKTRMCRHRWNMTPRANPDAAPTFPPPFTHMALDLRYEADDLDPGADPLAFEGSYRALDVDSLYRPLPISFRGATMTSVGYIASSQFVNGSSGGTWTMFLGKPSIVQVSVADTSAAEGGPGPAGALAAQAGGNLSFRVSLSEAAVDTVLVDHETVDGTATIADDDYAPIDGTLVFLPGQVSKTVVVPIVGDGTPERHESLGLQMSNVLGTHVALGDAAAQGTVLDDDDVTPPTVTVTSPNGGEDYAVGAEVDLDWTAVDDVFVSGVDLRLSRDGGSTWETVATGLPNTGSYAWTATAPLSTQMRLEVVAVDDPGNVGDDASDGDWEVGAVDAVDGASLAFALAPPSPNPARGTARFAFTLPEAGRVRLVIHDLMGRRVATLVDGELGAGPHEARWAAVGAPGVYLVRLASGGRSIDRRVLIVR